LLYGVLKFSIFLTISYCFYIYDFKQFHRKRFAAKSNELTWAVLSGHASRRYSNMGTQKQLKGVDLSAEANLNTVHSSRPSEIDFWKWNCQFFLLLIFENVCRGGKTQVLFNMSLDLSIVAAISKTVIYNTAVLVSVSRAALKRQPTNDGDAGVTVPSDIYLKRSPWRFLYGGQRRRNRCNVFSALSFTEHLISLLFPHLINEWKNRSYTTQRTV